MRAAFAADEERGLHAVAHQGIPIRLRRGCFLQGEDRQVVLRFWTSEHAAGVNQLVVGILDAIWALREASTVAPRITGT